VTTEIAESIGYEGVKGAIVSDVQDDSPAEAAKLASGDIITAVNGAEVETPKELSRMISGIEPGQSVDVTVWRKGKSEVFKVDLGELPGAEQQASAAPNDEQDAPAESDTLADLGLTMTPSDDGKGLVVTDVESGSTAAERGIEAGDVITEVNSVEVAGADDIAKAMADAEKAGRKAVLVQVTREDTSRFVTFPVSKG
jgi:serine protease Do